MRQLLANIALILALSLVGCGAPKDQGPGDASDTPQVNEADVQKTIESSMPDDMKKKYGDSAGQYGPGPEATTPSEDSE